MPKYSLGEISLLSGITLVAAILRLYSLTTIPPGFQFDQAFNAFDILRLLQGQFEIFFPANTGREPFYFYLSIVNVAIYGPTAVAMKLTGAVVGIATIPTVYFFARSFFQSKTIAYVAAAIAAVSFWHLFFSRYGLRVILEVPLTLLTFWYLWRALKQPNRRDFIMCGLFLALALYTYPSARLLPVAFVFLTLLAIRSHPQRLSQYAWGILVTFVLALVLFAPLGVYFLYQPDQFIAHTQAVSIFDPRVNEGDIPAALSKNLVALGQSFLIRGDGGSIHNLPYRPLFDPFVGAFFIIGVALGIGALLRPRGRNMDRDRTTFLLVWILVSLASSLFSDDAPNFLRMLPALPPLVAVAASGAWWLWQWLDRSLPRRVGLAVIIAVMVSSAFLTIRDYFVHFANLPELYYTFDVDKVEIAEWINQNTDNSHIYLAPLWYHQGTISLLTRNARLKSFESRDTIVLPSRAAGKDAYYGFPLEQGRKIETLATRLGSLGVRQDLFGSRGWTTLLVYRIPASNLPDLDDPLGSLSRGGAFLQPSHWHRALWGDSFRTLGYSVTAADEEGRNLTVTLFVQALQRMLEDYTFSIKVRDGQGRVWGQEDKWLGNNSYATSQWDEGDLIIERFYPGLHACAPAGNYHITAEAYAPRTDKVLEVDGKEWSAINLGSARALASKANHLEHMDPERTIEVDVGPQLRLLGYTLTPNAPLAGDAFSLSLFWRGHGDGGLVRPIVLTLRDSANTRHVLTQAEVKLPRHDRGLCTHLDLRMPIRIASGSAALFLNDVKLAETEAGR